MRRGRDWALLLAFVAAAASLPSLVTSDFALNLAIMALLLAFIGQGWNILGGYCGQLSFGHAMFFGMGAYASAVLQVRLGFDPWSAAAIGVALGAAVGCAVGWLSFRYGLRGSYFALATLAFAEIFRILASSVEFTGGGAGILIALSVGAANLQFAGKAGFYYIALGLAAASVALVLAIERTRFGAYMAAVRENEDAAKALGIDTLAIKLRAIALSGALTALGGSLYAQMFLYIDPRIAFGPAVSVEALLVAIVGGMGTPWGPLLGAAALQSLGEIAKRLIGTAPGLDLALYGILLVLMVRFLPAGVAGMRVRKRA